MCFCITLMWFNRENAWINSSMFAAKHMGIEEKILDEVIQQTDSNIALNNVRLRVVAVRPILTRTFYPIFYRFARIMSQRPSNIIPTKKSKRSFMYKHVNHGHWNPLNPWTFLTQKNLWKFWMNARVQSV